MDNIPSGPEGLALDAPAAHEIDLRAAKVFTPATPVHQRQFFAGRVKQLQSAIDGTLQLGQHVAIFGERGVGKTSLARILRACLNAIEPESCVIFVNCHTKDTFGSMWRKSLEEVTFNKVTPAAGFTPSEVVSRTSLVEHFGLTDEPSPDHVRRCLSALPRSIFVFDEFDRLNRQEAKAFTDVIKMLSDFAIDCTVVIVGVSDTVTNLVKDHRSIDRNLVQVPLRRMKFEELCAIIDLSSKELGIVFEDDAKRWIAVVSQGLPNYTHLLGLYAVRAACRRLSRCVETKDVWDALSQAVEKSDAVVSEAYTRAIYSPRSDAIYTEVLLACAFAQTDSSGQFNPSRIRRPLEEILGRPVHLSTFARHLGELCKKRRATVLVRSGPERRHRYRFSNPLLPPYAIMVALKEGLISAKALERITGQHMMAAPVPSDQLLDPPLY